MQIPGGALTATTPSLTASTVTVGPCNPALLCSKHWLDDRLIGRRLDGGRLSHCHCGRMHRLPLRRGCCHAEDTASLEDLLNVPHGSRFKEVFHLCFRPASRSGELRGESVRLVPSTSQIFLSGVRLDLGVGPFTLSALQSGRESVDCILPLPTHIGEAMHLRFKTKFLLLHFCLLLSETFTQASI